ncbi:MAG: metal ABC transporter permease [Oligosphaeraceae bacterium]
MAEFLQELPHSALLLRSLLAMALAAVCCGVVGCYVVLKRDSYAVGAVSHSLLGGVGAVLYLQGLFPALEERLPWLTPWMGGLAAGVAVAILITLLTTRWNFRMDTVLSALWALGMALGVSFVNARPGYGTELTSYLFGSILIISRQDLWIIAALDGIVLLMALLWHSRFVALAFHDELLTLRGLSRGRVQLAFQLMVAMTVVVLSQLVGTVLCMALLILPVAATSLVFRRIPVIMAVSGVLCFLCALGGVGVSYGAGPGSLLRSPGAVIVELAGLAYLLFWLLSRLLAFLEQRHQPGEEEDDADTSPAQNEDAR